MNDLFEVKQTDIGCYYNYIKDFLPDKIIDIHTHVYLKDNLIQGDKADKRLASWPELVAEDNSFEDILETYELMFPGKTVIPLMFPFPIKIKNINVSNQYILDCIGEQKYYGLILADPEWDADVFERKIRMGDFKGAKVYLNFAPAYIPLNEICIFDFLPHHQLSILNKYGMIVMLHIPRDNRLKDPVNLAQIIEIERRYPAVKLIIAHVGRAYCKEDVGNAFEILAETKNVLFDFCANTNQWVFEQLIKAVGPKRILFGSDLPITRMRMKRICENGIYVNVISKGMYGDVSNDKNMREIEGDEADRLTFFLYEEILAFRLAAIETKLSNDDIKDVFYNNAMQLLKR
ncbi:MAG: amidohydrolase [Prolixibacteraceae bacterium]|jgi:predicted TIM-barrel fold metal-dependent hydrolase|nr:amidohydrolase [Prolixibacteraceae bacterium]